MSTDPGTELNPNTEYPYEIKTRIVGNVDLGLVREVVSTVKEVFREMNYLGEPPEIVSISEGAVLLPSGEEMAGVYGYDAPEVPGRIYLSSTRSKQSFGNSPIGINIATAAFAAHEAVEHVNNMRGKKLLSSHKKLSKEEHKSETEDEANQIARKIIERKYGWTVRFGDETYYEDSNY